MSDIWDYCPKCRKTHSGIFCSCESQVKSIDGDLDRVLSNSKSEEKIHSRLVRISELVFENFLSPKIYEIEKVCKKINMRVKDENLVITLPTKNHEPITISSGQLSLNKALIPIENYLPFLSSSDAELVRSLSLDSKRISFLLYFCEDLYVSILGDLMCEYILENMEELKLAA